MVELLYKLSVVLEYPKALYALGGTKAMPLGDEIVHKALANDVRREILLRLAKGDKYLTELAGELKKKPQTIDFHLSLLAEIGLVRSESRGGKKYYSLADRHIIHFLEERRQIPPELRPKPPHEIMLEMWDDLQKRLERLERKVDRLARKR